ncbi:MAG: hypothetical protein HFI89_03465 [Lachnospiraceae bacterium]|nr:hypothetical protein [Lachnospiraceae bacterium]
MSIAENEYFIQIDDAENRLRRELNENFDYFLFKKIINKFLIVTVLDNGNKYLSIDELKLCKKLIKLNQQKQVSDMEDIYYNESFLVETIRLSKDTVLIYEICDSNKVIPAFVKNILYFYSEECFEKCEATQFELLGIVVRTVNPKICSYIQNAIFRKYKLDRLKTSNFANSSSYMGTKKKLTSFIIESMYPHCEKDSFFLDIMCGSGAVSNALAQMGYVYASDAQEFCSLLAKIQGAGFCKKQAEKLIKEIYSYYNYNLGELKKIFSKELELEDTIFRMDLDEKEKVFDSYKEFINSYQLYSDTYKCQKDIYDKINNKKKEIRSFPYFLFTYYFANVFFGVAQCVQLDSIRYAIDQIADEEDREWALGVLIVVTSLIATTYGGHFAQPKRLDMDSFEKILIQRSKSAWIEFSKRILTIAAESERYSYRIERIKGPWENALNYFRGYKINQLVVYLDAPYKREEYSRYYHVLETMVKYDYPSSEYKGRMRSKKGGERFSTEFFSKSSEKIEKVFEKIIFEILTRGAICVWSYSDNGVVSMKSVVTKIKEKTKCNVFFYSIPYKHSSQGKKSKKGIGKIDVTEYCIVFVNSD